MDFRVSVLVTFYNQENYVDKALESIIGQETEFGMRIIVGDDGSTDDTQKKVQSWINRYPDMIEMHVMDREDIKYISGFRASKNRLNLLRYVNTKYFIFLDGDDYFDYAGKLQEQVEILDNPIYKDCVACGHNVDMLFKDGKRVPITADIAEGKYGKEEYWGNLYFHTDSLLIRSEIIPTINVRLVENNFNDNMITFIIMQSGKIYYIPKSWGVYLQTGDGIWTTGDIIVNQIRNMFLYDLCNIIDPSLKKQSFNKFSAAWFDLFKNRKDIDANKLELYSREAAEKMLCESYRWIHYNELSLFNKRIWDLKVLLLCRRRIVKAIVSKFI